jgi:hypothetical protein
MLFTLSILFSDWIKKQVILIKSQEIFSHSKMYFILSILQFVVKSDLYSIQRIPNGKPKKRLE